MSIRNIVFLFYLCFSISVIAMDNDPAESIPVIGKAQVHSTIPNTDIRPCNNVLETEDSLGDFASIGSDNMLEVFSHFTLRELDQVVPLISRAFYHISANSIVWTHALGDGKFDYDNHSQCITREQYRLHKLKVLINSMSDNEKKLALVKKYNLQPSEEKCMKLLRDKLNCYPHQTAPFLDHLIIQQCCQNLRNHLGIVGPIERRISNTNPSVGKFEGSPMTFIAYWVEQGSLEAMQLKITRYQTDDQETLLLNDKLIEAGNEEAMNRKIKGCYDHGRGLSPFQISVIESFQLNEELVERKNSEALNRRVSAHIGGWYGYPRDVNRAFDLSLNLALEGDPSAIGMRFETISRGNWDLIDLFPPNPEAAIEFIETLVARRDPSAISMKLQQLEHDSSYGFGYVPNSAHLIAFNKELKREGISIAFLNEIRWKAAGLHGYPCEPEAAFTLRKDFLEGTHSQAYKVEAILYPTSEEGFIFTKTKELIMDFEDKLRFVRHLKAYGLKYGMFGFEEDAVAASEYITHYAIAF